MLYTKKSFTLPTVGKIMTVEQYEISVGVRCPDCKKLTSKSDEKRSKQCCCKK